MFIVFNPLELLISVAYVYADGYNNCAGLSYSANQVGDMSKMLSTGQYCSTPQYFPSNETGFMPPAGPGYCANQSTTPCTTGGGSGYYPPQNSSGNTTNIIPGMNTPQSQECSIVTSVECAPKQSGSNGSLVPQRFSSSQTSTDNNGICNQQSNGGFVPGMYPGGGSSSNEICQQSNGGFIPGMYPGGGSSNSGPCQQSNGGFVPGMYPGGGSSNSGPCQQSNGGFIPGMYPGGGSSSNEICQQGNGGFIPGMYPGGGSSNSGPCQQSNGGFIPGQNLVSPCNSYQNGFSGLFDCSNPSIGKTPINTAYIGTSELPVVPGFSINPSSCGSSNVPCTPSA